MKIAFDLDGVLIPDFAHIPDLSDSEFYKYISYSLPVFEPTYQYDVITARSEIHRTITERWLSNMLVPPTNVYMKQEESKDSSAVYKYKMLKGQGYKIFVESDLRICNDLAQLFSADKTAPTIIHFPEFINTKLLEQ